MANSKIKLLISSLIILQLVQPAFAESSAVLVKNRTSSSKSSSTVKKAHHRKKHRAKVHSKNYMYGTASYYNDKFSCRQMANGNLLEMAELTAAHPTLPLGSKLKVTNLHNGRVIYVEITDRMPKKSGHVIDLTIAGAKALGFYAHGLTKVDLDRISNQEYTSQMQFKKTKASVEEAATEET